MTGAVFTEGIYNIAAGADPMSISRGIEKGLAQALKVIDGMSEPVKGRKEISRIATIASGGDA